MQFRLAGKCTRFADIEQKKTPLASGVVLRRVCRVPERPVTRTQRGSMTRFIHHPPATKQAAWVCTLNLARDRQEVKRDERGKRKTGQEKSPARPRFLLHPHTRKEHSIYGGAREKSRGRQVAPPPRPGFRSRSLRRNIPAVGIPRVSPLGLRRVAAGERPGAWRKLHQADSESRCFKRYPSNAQILLLALSARCGRSRGAGRAGTSPVESVPSRAQSIGRRPRAGGRRSRGSGNRRRSFRSFRRSGGRGCRTLRRFPATVFKTAQASHCQAPPDHAENTHFHCVTSPSFHHASPN